MTFQEMIDTRKTLTIDEAKEIWGDCMFEYDEIDMPVAVFSYADTLGYIEVQADGTFYCIVTIDDIVSRDLEEVENFLYVNWVSKEAD